MNNYKPGISNAGSKDVQKFQDMAIGAGMITMGWTFISYVWIFPTLLQILVFIPAYFCALGIIQFRNKFGVMYGITQKENSDDALEPHNVIDSDSIEKDRERATFIILLAVFLALIYSVLIIFIL